MDQNQMEQEEGITLGELLQMIRKHIVSAIVVCVVVFAAVAAYTFMAPKKYEATAELLAMSGQGAISDNAQRLAVQLDRLLHQHADRHLPAAGQDRSRAGAVIDDLGLDTTVAETAELITASNPDGTFMVDITAETEDPALSQQLANAVADSLSEQVSTSMNTVSEDQAPVSLSVVQQAALRRARARRTCRSTSRPAWSSVSFWVSATRSFVRCSTPASTRPPTSEASSDPRRSAASRTINPAEAAAGRRRPAGWSDCRGISPHSHQHLIPEDRPCCR